LEKVQEKFSNGPDKETPWRNLEELDLEESYCQ
jgi:hypothetical protein